MSGMTTTWTPPPGQPLQPGPGGLALPRPRGSGRGPGGTILTGLMASVVVILIAVIASAGGSSGGNTGSNTTPAAASRRPAGEHRTRPARSLQDARRDRQKRRPDLQQQWRVGDHRQLPQLRPGQAPPTAPEYSVCQQQAIDAAEGYLTEGQGFPRAGLYPAAPVTVRKRFLQEPGHSRCRPRQVNWWHQAVLSAEGYVSDGAGFATADWCSSLSRCTATSSLTRRPPMARRRVGSDERPGHTAGERAVTSRSRAATSRGC